MDAAADILGAGVVILAIAGVIGGAVGMFARSELKSERERTDRLEGIIAFEREDRRVNEQRMQARINALDGQVQFLQSDFLSNHLKPAVVAAVKEAISGTNGRSS